MSESVVVPEPKECNFHPGRRAEVDGKTKYGYWANMCGICFDVMGVGLGTGRGQRIVSRT